MDGGVFTPPPSAEVVADVAPGEDQAPPADQDEEPNEGVPLARGQGLREEAKSLNHRMTHFPKNPFCDICQRAKAQRASLRGFEAWVSSEGR